MYYPCCLVADGCMVVAFHECDDKYLCIPFFVTIFLLKNKEAAAATATSEPTLKAPRPHEVAGNAINISSLQTFAKL